MSKVNDLFDAALALERKGQFTEAARVYEQARDTCTNNDHGWAVLERRAEDCKTYARKARSHSPSDDMNGGSSMFSDGYSGYDDNSGIEIRNPISNPRLEMWMNRWFGWIILAIALGAMIGIPILFPLP